MIADFEEEDSLLVCVFGHAYQFNYIQNFLRMNIDGFHTLLELVSPLIKKQDSNMREALSVGERLALTLRILATGDSFMSLQYLLRISQSTISTIIPEVCDAIYKALNSHQLKKTGWNQLIISTIVGIFQGGSICQTSSVNPLWNFPYCIGAIDGKHIVMKAHSGSVYFNYKGTHSVVLMAIADAKYRFTYIFVQLLFTYIDIGVNGRIPDGGINLLEGKT
ncbi:uncharacterized protein LOC129720301 [Wyeomyia smithii]|uniref:uncharacterized protein LOC129720301 n=1 Tax=Wyeomyia smithii TaxID=174621 RepID=UPI002467F289|nr:uncharacterized protein LOC129720301 [Wyeomyia smithii]